MDINYKYVCTAFSSYLTIFYEKSLIEICSLHIYVSFGTFCVTIGQLLDAQYSASLKIRK